MPRANPKRETLPGHRSGGNRYASPFSETTFSRESLRELASLGQRERYDCLRVIRGFLQSNRAQLIESQRVDDCVPSVGTPQRAASLNPAMTVSLRSAHRAPQPEGLLCRDAPPQLVCGRRSRGLAPGWQSEGEDIHFGQSCSFEGSRLRLGFGVGGDGQWVRANDQ